MKKKRRIKFKLFIILIMIVLIVVYVYFEKIRYIKPVFPDEVYGVKVNTQLVESQTKARSGEKRKIKYIVIHETDNTASGANASNHAEYLSKNNKTSTSWHYTVDDTKIYHHISDDEVANHAGDRIGNLYGIGIELCVNETGDFEKTFENATKLVAFLLKEYKLKVKDIKTHHDFSGKDCPHSILKNDRMWKVIYK